jgi:RHS repeat-associated protein
MTINYSAEFKWTSVSANKKTKFNIRENNNKGNVGLYIDELLSYTDHSDPQNPETYFVTTDRQFSVRTVVDSQGNIVEERDYDPMGKDMNGVAESSDLAYGFTGRRYDHESDLYYFRARYYSTELGGFISRDPLEYVDGMNMYSGYFARRFGLDPSGTEISVVETELKANESDIRLKPWDYARTVLHYTSPVLKWVETKECCENAFPDTYFKLEVTQTAESQSSIEVIYKYGIKNSTTIKDDFGQSPSMHESVHVNFRKTLVSQIDELYSSVADECVCDDQLQWFLKVLRSKANILILRNNIANDIYDIDAYSLFDGKKRQREVYKQERELFRRIRQLEVLENKKPTCL